MTSADLSSALAALFAELTEGAHAPGGAFILNSGDGGLLSALDGLSAADASQSVTGGATVAAHAQHVRYGLSLMNRWAREGGNPFADATWDAAWKISAVSDGEWADIRAGLRLETGLWKDALGKPRDASGVELRGLIGSVAHTAYHLGAIRQIAANARGPREGTFT
jgi:hypothetical protein